MKHVKHKKLMLKAILVAGSCMLIALYSGGCEWNYTQQRQAMGEFFPPAGEVRATCSGSHARAGSVWHSRRCDPLARAFGQG